MLLSIGAVLYLASGSDPVDPPPAEGDKTPGRPIDKDPKANGGGHATDPVAPAEGPEQKDYADLERFARASPDEYEQIIQRSTLFFATYSKSTRLADVERIRDGARADAETAARRALRPIREEAKRLEDRDELWAAADEYRLFPDSLKFTAAWKEGGAMDRPRLMARIDERWKVDQPNWERAIQEERLGQAIDILTAVIVYADPDRRKEAEQIKDEVEKRAAVRPPTIDESEPFEEFARAFVDGLGMGRWNWSGADAALVEKSFTQEPYARHWKGFRSDLELLKSLPDVTRKVLQARADARGTLVLPAPLGECTITEVGPRGVDLQSLQSAGAEVSREFPELPEELIFHDLLATRGIGLAEADRHRVIAIHLLWVAGEARKARKIPSARQALSRVGQILADLGRRSIDVDRWSAVAKRVDGDVRELEAELLLEKAKEEIRQATRTPERRTLWVSPIVRLRRLASGEFSETKFAESHHDEVQQLLQEAEEARGSGS